MADDTNKTGDDATEDNQLTLTRTEIAFLDAIIEAKREEERGSSESVTIPLDLERAATAALAKTGIAVARWVNWAYEAYAAMGGVTPVRPGGGGASRQEIVDQIKSIVDPSLDELTELREQIEKQRGSKGGS